MPKRAVAGILYAAALVACLGAFCRPARALAAYSGTAEATVAVNANVPLLPGFVFAVSKDSSVTHNAYAAGSAREIAVSVLLRSAHDEPLANHTVCLYGSRNGGNYAYRSCAVTDRRGAATFSPFEGRQAKVGEYGFVAVDRTYAMPIPLQTVVRFGLDRNGAVAQPAPGASAPTFQQPAGGATETVTPNQHYYLQYGQGSSCAVQRPEGQAGLLGSLPRTGPPYHNRDGPARL